MRYYWITTLILSIIVILWVFRHSILEELNSQDIIIDRIFQIFLIIPAFATVVTHLYLFRLHLKKIPVLEFTNFTKTDSQLNPIYFVRVRNNNGEGKAINCIGGIDIGSSHSRTVWASESINSEILHHSHEDLRLFRIENIEKPISSINKTLLPKTIWISTLKPENLRNYGLPYTESEKPFEDYKDKEITINVDADRGKSISLTKKISEIIDEAVVEE